MALIIRPLMAEFSSQYSQIPSEMNAYCSMTIRHQRKFSSLHPCHGNEANWDQAIVFDIDTLEEDLWVELWIQQFGMDRKIGEGNIDLKRHYNRSSYRQVQKMDLKIGEKTIGGLNLTIQYKTTKQQVEKLRKQQEKQKPDPIRVPVIQTVPENNNVIKPPQFINTNSVTEWATVKGEQFQSFCSPVNQTQKKIDDPAGLFSDIESNPKESLPFQAISFLGDQQNPINHKVQRRQSIKKPQQTPVQHNQNFGHGVYQSPMNMTPQQYQHHLKMQQYQRIQYNQNSHSSSPPNKHNPAYHRVMSQQQQKLNYQQTKPQLNPHRNSVQQGVNPPGIVQPNPKLGPVAAQYPQNYMPAQTGMLGSHQYAVQPPTQQYYQQYYNFTGR